MASRMGRKGMAAFAGGMLAASPLIVACGSSEPSYEDWAATDGAAGRINLDDVQQAFKSSKSATEFEQRVNEIYEGDGIILIRAAQDGDRLTLEGWEDLNANNQIDDGQDDRLFSIVKENDEYDMQGYHANSYYRSHFGAGDFLFTYLLISALMPGPYFYHTPVGYGPTLRQSRANYRQSGRYGAQVARNSRYATKQQGFAGSRYQESGRNVSSNRQTYQQTQRTSGAFRNSSAVSRTGSSVSTINKSSASRVSRARSSGSFGGGGGQVRLRNRAGSGHRRGQPG